MDNTLQHHGILGQKWGVRRFQNSDGTLTSAGRRRVKKKFVKSYNQASQHMNSHVLPETNKKYEGQDIGVRSYFQTKSGQKYISELDSHWRNTYINTLKSNNPELFQMGSDWVNDNLPFIGMYSQFKK